MTIILLTYIPGALSRKLVPLVAKYYYIGDIFDYARQSG